MDTTPQVDGKIVFVIQMKRKIRGWQDIEQTSNKDKAMTRLSYYRENYPEKKWQLVERLVVKSKKDLGVIA